MFCGTVYKYFTHTHTQTHTHLVFSFTMAYLRLDIRRSHWATTWTHTAEEFSLGTGADQNRTVIQYGTADMRGELNTEQDDIQV
jgi:hypothetical protein